MEYREAFIRSNCAAECRNDFLDIAGSGAQQTIQILRIDNQTILVVAGTERVILFKDGEHPIGYTVSGLRFTDTGWRDVTRDLFPFKIAPHSIISLAPDGVMTVSGVAGKKTRRFQLRGKRFVELPRE